MSASVLPPPHQEGKRAPKAQRDHAAAQRPRAGLVLCAITGHGTPAEASATGPAAAVDVAGLIDGLWSPRFPSADLVSAAAALFTPAQRCDVGRAGVLEEGPSWRITISPGALQVGTRDEARAERTYERQLEAGRRAIDAEASWANLDDDEAAALFIPDEPPTPRGRITSWSRKSRARMVKTLCELDYAPLLEANGIPAMVTLTAPGDWLAVLPSKEVASAKLKAFRKRFLRSWGRPLVGPWKLEFQRRGAPHWHILMVPPRGRSDPRYAHGGLSFRQWLSRTWTDVLDPPDPEERRRSLLAGTGVDFNEGLRASDPRRVAAYFTKHGVMSGKEYQHTPPEEWLEAGGTGRWWGVWGLERTTAVVELEPDEAIAAARVMRRYTRAQRHYRQETRPRTAGGRVESKYPEVIGLAGAQLVAAHRPRRPRRTRVRVVQVRRSRGWIALNDGPAFASDLARWLDQRRADGRQAHPGRAGGATAHARLPAESRGAG